MKLLAQAGGQIAGTGAPAQFSDLHVIFSNVVGLVIGLAGIVLFIMFIVGGFNYLTAGSNPGAAENARKTLTYAIAGLVFIALAFLVLRLIASFTGINSILDFQIAQ